jgi:hypothetical protein
MMNLQIVATGFDELQKIYQYADRRVPELAESKLAEIATHLVDSVRDEISGDKDPYGFVYSGSLLGSVVATQESPTEIDIWQSEDGNFILYGTKGSQSAPPPRLVDWALLKLNVASRHEAYGAALGIIQQGILSGKRAHWGTVDGFNYADYIVNQKEVQYLQEQAQNLEGLVVKYLDTGL